MSRLADAWMANPDVHDRLGAVTQLVHRQGALHLDDALGAPQHARELALDVAAQAGVTST